MSSDKQPSQFQVLKATYSSPTNDPFTHNQEIPAPPTTKTVDRVAYLASLRKATVDLQECINKELTTRMEEDKARDAADAKENGKKITQDDSKAEDNYGEEVVEEDD